MSLSVWREDSRMIKKKLKISKMKSKVRELLGISKETFTFWNWVKSTELTITKQLQKKWILIDWLSKTVWENCSKSLNLNLKISKNRNLSDLTFFNEFSIGVLKFHQDQLQQTTKQKLNLLILTFKFIKTNWTLILRNLKLFQKCQSMRTHRNTMRLIKLTAFLAGLKRHTNKSFRSDDRLKSRCSFEVHDRIQDMVHKCHLICLQEHNLQRENSH